MKLVSSMRESINIVKPQSTKISVIFLKFQPKCTKKLQESSRISYLCIVRKIIDFLAASCRSHRTYANFAFQFILLKTILTVRAINYPCFIRKKLFNLRFSDQYQLYICSRKQTDFLIPRSSC